MMGTTGGDNGGGSVSKAQLELFARCASGFEEVLAQELRDMRMRRVRPQVGGVSFFGRQADAYRACLWSRVATRIQLVLDRVPCATADELYQGAVAFPWEDHVPRGATIAVDAHGQNPQLRNTQFTALKVKDALCDRLRDQHGMRPDVNAKDPDVAIDVAVHERKATLYLNLSGTSLHRRGYRQDGVQTEAPLKETLAAGILLAAGWPDMAREGGMLADPMCGSGTFAIEAALIAADIAPGLLRERWGFEGWAQHDEQLWARLHDEALLQRTYPQGPAPIVAGDLDARAVDIARFNADRADVEDLIQFFVDDAARLKRHLGLARKRGEAPGLLVANPPYGERLLAQEDLPQVYSALAAAIDAVPKSWQVALITPDAGIDSALGRTPHTTLACYNGPLEAWVRLYAAKDGRKTLHVMSLSGVSHEVSVAEDNSAQFGARLRKAAKERVRTARRQNVSCYRVYDADLPDYALSVDLYETADGGDAATYACVKEYHRPARVDVQRAARRFADAATIVAAVLDIPSTQVVARPWGSERDAAGRRRASSQPRLVTVEEGDCRYEVDLMHPSVSLPLAQRGVRALARKLAPGARVAALFATSGTALVQAAAGGARQSVTVDAARPWLDSVGTSLAANGLSGKAHRLSCMDVRAWVSQERRAHHTYDLILCLPPIWLSARDAGREEWNLGRDGIDLVHDAMGILSQTGTLLFACAAQDAPDVASLRMQGLQIEDMSDEVVPFDFTRARQAQCCYLIRRG